jgi:hypothetical protein
MTTRIVFIGGQEVTISQPEEQVVLAIRRDHPNPVKLEHPDGRPLHVNWDHIALIEETA